MNIVVLAGGISTEREVSLSSGAMVCEALRNLGHRALLLDVFFGMEEVPAVLTEAFGSQQKVAQTQIYEEAPDIEAVKRLRPDSGLGNIGKNVIELCKAADIVYLGLHGEDGENGRLQALFDVLGIKYTGSGYLGSALAMNKWITKQLLCQNGIATPKGKAFYKGQSLEGADSFGFPCIIKPCSGGSSIGVSIVNDKKELEAALDAAFVYEQEVLVEEYIQGREVSAGILGGEALPIIEIIPKGEFYDYAHKYQKGWTEEVCPANMSGELTGRVQAAAKRVFEVLKLEVYGRVDFMIDSQGHAYCLEANTLPGMTPTSLLPQEAQAVEISYGELCQHIIDLSLKKYRG